MNKKRKSTKSRGNVLRNNASNEAKNLAKEIWLEISGFNDKKFMKSVKRSAKN